MKSLKRHHNSKGFSIIELLLVLTIVSVFLGAVFIAYRTINANVNEQKYADQAMSFLMGLKDYYNTIGAYPQTTCTDGNSWNNSPSGSCDWNSHPPASPANCCALMHFIGPWASTWSYISGTSSFTIVTSQIPKDYINAVSNKFNNLGLLCTVSSLSGDYGYLSCSANNVVTSSVAINN